MFVVKVLHSNIEQADTSWRLATIDVRSCMCRHANNVPALKWLKMGPVMNNNFRSFH